MKYKAVLLSGTWQSDWYATEQEAWDYISTVGCNFNKPCEMCQAEYSVFSEDELKEEL